MPNHVTNKISAPAEVLRSILNDDGCVDFNKIRPFGGTFEWNGISCSAENAAEAITNQPLDTNPVIAALQQSNRSRIDVLAMLDECFEQFVQMLRNKRACGYFHQMDFARDKWGTKWNAYDQLIELDEGRVKFDTAWSCPVPVLVALSELHQDAEITVAFADEDLGCNCGTIILKGGQIISEDVAGKWREMSEADRKKWTEFARQLKGWERDEDEDEE